MQTILAIEGVGHDVEELQELLRNHGYDIRTITESSAQDERQQYERNVLENVPIGMFRFSLDGKLLEANQTLADMCKYDSPKQMVAMVNGGEGGGFIHANPFRSQQVIAMALQSDDWQSFEGRFRCKDGSFIDTCLRFRRVPHAQDQVEGFAEDITERKRIDEALRFTQYVVENTADQAFWLTEDAKVFYVNDAACRALGYRREELIGMSIHEFDPAYPIKDYSLNWEKLRPDGSRIIETWHRTKGGRVYPVEVRINHVEFDGKEYHCTFVTDISRRRATETILRESENRYRQLMEMLPIAAYTTDADGRITFYNRNAAELWGRKPELNKELWCGSFRLWYPDGRPMAFDACPMAKTLKQGKRFQGQEVLIEREQDGYAHVVAYPEPLYDADGNLIGALNLLVDITVRKQVEQQLLQANLVVENSPVVLFRWKAEPGWPVVLVTKNITQFGYEPEEFLSGKRMFASIIHPADRERVAREVEVFAARGVDRFEQQYRILGRGGKVCWISDQTNAERDEEGQVTHYEGIVIDISERKHAEERIKASLVEKEVLLKEIHHRVKNNLQVVSSLLYLQAQKLHDPEAKTLFAESQSRICSMALAHEQLYQSKNLADISLLDYVQSLVSHVKQTFMSPQSVIDCKVDVDDGVLDIEKVVPCGLLITELLSNALKHAFPDGTCGSIKVEITRQNGSVNLCVADDGIGLPAGFDYRKAETLGLQLVCALVQQLDGSLSVQSRRGTSFNLSFPG
ncbi:sensor histidine kinase, PAS, PAS, PAS and PAS domain-containing [Syntrophotalea carbinolica DSM 2380]|uniref:histidine kinase n=1 Tax=Syntrophotalea carbinolica (strain DSM 2380 / NBRC 103641 / GraBd1) TaxID=338963 RepID=Q3A111_SYNC1|nr:PAS domain S-box protein [Syntrophotalea carbinolica]ABA89946.1 sensor histidine kinase, PAS, PAS, PAS and PAS domain-containing [Syntrophotalea carbinolica DSM 2380]